MLWTGMKHSSRLFSLVVVDVLAYRERDENLY